MTFTFVARVGAALRPCVLSHAVSRLFRLPASGLVGAAAVCLFLLACGGDGDSEPSGVRAIAIEPMGLPSIISDGDGRTRIITSFVARADQGSIRRALTVGETEVGFYLDGAKVSGESVLDRNELGGDLFYTLVLDGSYSMLSDHTPPAFQPMLSAARASIDEIAREWQQRGTAAEVRFDWLWFDDYVHYPDDKSGASISLVPAPRSGENDTRLFGAVDYMFKRHVATAATGFATETQDRHVMVVFTDGNDNRSYFVTTESNERVESPVPHVKHRPGIATVDQVELIARINAARAANRLPGFTLHAIGLGTSVRAEPLRELATSQSGVFVQNPSSRNLSELFSAITREVVSIQTVGVRLPLRPGRYQLNVRVSLKDDPERFAEYPLDFTAQ